MTAPIAAPSERRRSNSHRHAPTPTSAPPEASRPSHTRAPSPTRALDPALHTPREPPRSLISAPPATSAHTSLTAGLTAPPNRANSGAQPLANQSPAAAVAGAQQSREQAINHSIERLEQAIAAKNPQAAIPAATTLAAALEANPEAIDDVGRDRLCNALRAAFRAAEEENAWPWWKTLLSVLALGIPFIVKALNKTEMDKLEEICGDAVMAERRRIVDTMTIEGVDGASERNVRRVRDALLMLPEPVLRTIRDVTFQASGERDPDGFFGWYRGDSQTAVVHAMPWYFFNQHLQPTTIHEAMHAYEHLSGRHFSEQPEFLAAREADMSALRSYERRSHPSESFADTAVHYYYDMPAMARLFLRDRPHLIDYYRENIAVR